MYPIEGWCILPMDLNQTQRAFGRALALTLGTRTRDALPGSRHCFHCQRQGLELVSGDSRERLRRRAHPDLNHGPADLQSAALTTELCSQLKVGTYCLWTLTKPKGALSEPWRSHLGLGLLMHCRAAGIASIAKGKAWRWCPTILLKHCVEGQTRI